MKIGNQEIKSDPGSKNLKKIIVVILCVISFMIIGGLISLIMGHEIKIFEFLFPIIFSIFGGLMVAIAINDTYTIILKNKSIEIISKNKSETVQFSKIKSITNTTGNYDQYIRAPVDTGIRYVIELKEKCLFGKRIYFTCNKKYENGKNFGEILKEEWVLAVKASHQNKRRRR